MLDIVHLRSFVEVVEEGGFTRAAERLHLTQSAVSAHVRRLEEQLGQPLLQRTTRSVGLTPAGERLLGYARGMLALNRQALQQFAENTGRQVLRVGVSEDLAQLGLLHKLRQFREERPGLAVQVRTDYPINLERDLQQGALDLIAVGQCQPRSEGQLLWREPLCWFAARGAARLLADPVPLALFPEPCPYREVALACLAHSGLHSEVCLLSTSSEVLRNAALSGFAVAVLPASLHVQGLQRLGVEEGLSDLPAVEFRLMRGPSADDAALLELEAFILENARAG